MSRTAVCSTSELSPGERCIVSVEGVEIGVFNVDGEYHALLNKCPHQHGPVCEGELSRKVTGEFVEEGRHVKQKYADEMTVVCPWHKWSFEVTTGKHSGDDSISVPTYDTEVEDGTLYVVHE